MHALSPRGYVSPALLGMGIYVRFAVHAWPHITALEVSANGSVLFAQNSVSLKSLLSMEFYVPCPPQLRWGCKKQPNPIDFSIGIFSGRISSLMPGYRRGDISPRGCRPEGRYLRYPGKIIKACKKICVWRIKISLEDICPAPPQLRWGRGEIPQGYVFLRKPLLHRGDFEFIGIQQGSSILGSWEKKNLRKIQ